MKKSNNPYAIGLGIVLLICGVYWIYKSGELLEILLPIILGIGFIAVGYNRSEGEGADLS